MINLRVALAEIKNEKNIMFDDVSIEQIQRDIGKYGYIKGRHAGNLKPLREKSGKFKKEAVVMYKVLFLLALKKYGGALQTTYNNLREIAPDVPHIYTFFNWRKKDKEFSSRWKEIVDNEREVFSSELERRIRQVQLGEIHLLPTQVIPLIFAAKAVLGWYDVPKMGAVQEEMVVVDDMPRPLEAPIDVEVVK